MSSKDDKWDLNRRPNRWERVYGSVLSFVVFLIMLAFLGYSISYLMTTEEVSNQGAVIFVLASLCFIASTYLCWRVMFTKAQKPSPLIVMIAGFIIFGLSCTCLLLAVFVLGASQGQNIIIMSIGLIGLAGSITIITKQKRSENS